MSRMTNTVHVSRLQLRRLRKDIEQYHNLIDADTSSGQSTTLTESKFFSSSAVARTALFADLHLLMIQLHDADQLLYRLKRLIPQEPDLANLGNKHRTFIKRCDEFRKHLERVDGEHPADTGSLNGTIYSYHGKKFDVGPDFEKKVETLAMDILASWARIRDRQKRIRELITKGRSSGPSA